MCLTGKLDEQEEDAVKKRQEATELLEKLLAEQRAGFEEASRYAEEAGSHDHVDREAGHLP